MQEGGGDNQSGIWALLGQTLVLLGGLLTLVWVGFLVWLPLHLLGANHIHMCPPPDMDPLFTMV